MEEWKIAKNYDGYSCSKSGKIKNNQTGRILDPEVNNTGYITVALKNNDDKKPHVGIHRIIAETWIPNPENKLTVNHKNKDKTDNRVDNLEWFTYGEQNKHKSIGQKKSQNNIGIWKCDIETGKQIEFYETIREGAESVGKGNSEGNIITCAKGRINYAYGYKWEYDDSIFFNVEKDSYEEEEWKNIKDEYHISNNGRLRNGSRLLKLTIHDEYYTYSIEKKQYRVHRLVAKYFIPNPEKYGYVNHKNGNKLDNHYNNLEWCTSAHNAQHAIENGLKKNVRKIIQYDESYNITNIFNTAREASEKLDLDASGIWMCCNGKANVYDKNKKKLYFKFQEQSDDLTNKKIDTTNLLIKPKKERGESKQRKINIYDKQDNLLETCNSRVEASKKYNTHRNTITSHCNGTVKYSPCNYKFEYAD